MPPSWRVLPLTMQSAKDQQLMGNELPSLNVAFVSLSRISVEEEEPAKVIENSAMQTSTRPPSNSTRRRGRGRGLGSACGRGRNNMCRQERYCDKLSGCRSYRRKVLVQTWKTQLGKTDHPLVYCCN